MFDLHSEYRPTGDQPQAIEKLVDGFVGSARWLRSLKNLFGIRTRRVTAYVTKKKIAASKEVRSLDRLLFLRSQCFISFILQIEAACKDFVDDVKPLIAQYGARNVWNFDQSGINREMTVSFDEVSVMSINSKLDSSFSIL